ncbi:MAG: hypothetical protein LKF06_06405 [Prevotella sp.]|jgi:hypothetical protein|nr:hypothetical protein [Prevotella sp.]MCH4100218.1 hypothetical protein [Prevotella sp.]MCI2137816.1 hypothetical protein [Prevotella sp.]MCI2150714.1 hypothetical protein [Prevotella sp.]
MALAIKAIPTLNGEEAKKFENEATRVEANPGSMDYRKEAKVVYSYLKKINML